MNCPLSIYVSDASPQSKTRVLTMFKLHFKKIVPGSNIPNTIEKNNGTCLQLFHIYRKDYRSIILYMYLCKSQFNI